MRRYSDKLESSQKGKKNTLRFEVEEVSDVLEGSASFEEDDESSAEKVSDYAKRTAKRMIGGGLESVTDWSKEKLSKQYQKKRIRKEYELARRGIDTESTAGRAGSDIFEKGSGMITSMKERIVTFKDRLFQEITDRPLLVMTMGILLILALITSALLSSCSVMGPGTVNTVWASSYTAEDEEILGAEERYKTLEKRLKRKLENIESLYPGYDEYSYDLDELGHNPFELTSYLTVLYEYYSAGEVAGTLQELFDKQYILTLTPSVETRTVTVTTTDPQTRQQVTQTTTVNVSILNVKLENKLLSNVIMNSGMDESEMERYVLLNQFYGNRKYLFEDDIYAVSAGEYEDYDIPGEALTDGAFAGMIREAEKYLGFPYVWGGSNPSTSFDCSGFVSWVINHSGNGWNIGRQTANGLLGHTTRISAAEAQPGDLIFFQGTYNTSGASHVGIYVGGGMMIHCGNPISYASINSAYWQRHFLCFGRIAE